MVLQERIELSTSPLPRECSTTELRQQRAAFRGFCAVRQPVFLQVCAEPCENKLAGVAHGCTSLFRPRSGGNDVRFSAY